MAKKEVLDQGNLAGVPLRDCDGGTYILHQPRTAADLAEIDCLSLGTRVAGGDETTVILYVRVRGDRVWPYRGPLNAPTVPVCVKYPPVRYCCATGNLNASVHQVSQILIHFLVINLIPLCRRHDLILNAHQKHLLQSLSYTSLILQHSDIFEWLTECMNSYLHIVLTMRWDFG